MKILAAGLLLLTLLLAASASRAQEREALTLGQVLEATSGLQQLTRYDTVDKEGKPAVGYYKFGADTRYLIALNIDLGRHAQTQFQMAVNDVVMQMSEGKGSVPPEKKGEFDVVASKLMAAPSRTKLYPIKLKDLNLDENPIPATVLSQIVPIIER